MWSPILLLKGLGRSSSRALHGLSTCESKILNDSCATQGLVPSPSLDLPPSWFRAAYHLEHSQAPRNLRPWARCWLTWFVAPLLGFMVPA